MADSGTGAGRRDQFARVLAVRPARRLLFARSLSDFGDFLGLTAVLVHAFDTSGSVLGPGAVFAAQGAAAFAMGAFGGRWLNRLHPAGGLIGSHLTAAVVVLVLATTPPLPVVLALVAVLGALRSMAAPLRSAAMATSVPEDLRQPLFGLFGVSYQVGQVGGFVIGAGIVTLIGPAVALVADAATFVLAAALFVRAGIDRAAATEPPDATSGTPPLISGLRVVFANRRLALLAPLAWVTMLTSALPETLAPGLATGTSMGLLMAAAPIGSAAGAVWFGGRGADDDRTLFMQAAVFGVALGVVGVAFALGAPLWVIGLALVLSGASDAWTVGAQARFVSLPPPGRVAEANAAMASAVVVMEGIGALVLAALASWVGAAGPFLLMGVVTTAGAVAAASRTPRAAPAVHEPALT